MRYPTMQRVAHTLPKDPKYRSHVVRSIRVPWWYDKAWAEVMKVDMLKQNSGKNDVLLTVNGSWLLRTYHDKSFGEMGS